MSIAIDSPTVAGRGVSSRNRHAGDKAQGNGSAVIAETRRVLLVEDEVIVGMMMKDVLTEIGFHVVGPFGKVSDAIEVIDRERLGAAVLDVNLRGEMIYGLADELTGRGVPLVFVTGYGPEAIDARFANVPVLQKPVDSAALRRVLTRRRNDRLNSTGSMPANGHRAGKR